MTNKTYKTNRTNKLYNPHMDREDKFLSTRDQHDRDNASEKNSYKKKLKNNSSSQNEVDDELLYEELDLIKLRNEVEASFDDLFDRESIYSIELDTPFLTEWEKDLPHNLNLFPMFGKKYLSRIQLTRDKVQESRHLKLLFTEKAWEEDSSFQWINFSLSSNRCIIDLSYTDEYKQLIGEMHDNTGIIPERLRTHQFREALDMIHEERISRMEYKSPNYH